MSISSCRRDAEVCYSSCFHEKKQLWGEKLEASIVMISGFPTLKKFTFILQHSTQIECCTTEDHMSSSDSQTRPNLTFAAWGISCLYQEANCGQLSDLCDVLMRGYETTGCSKSQDMNVASSLLPFSLLERQSYILNRRKRISAFSC